MVISFIVLTLLLVLVILYFSFNKAVITIIPSEETISVESIVNIEEESPVGGLISETSMSGKVLEVEKESSQTFQSTGSKIVESEVIGKVTIINNYTKNQPLTRTTRLLTPDGILFRTNEGVTVPAGGQVEVEIYADDPSQIQGKTIKPTKMTIPGLWGGLQDKIYAQNDVLITSEGRKVTIVSQNDLDSAEDKIVGELIKEAVIELEQSLAGDYEVLSAVTYKEVLESNTDAKVGDEVDEFDFNVKAKITIIAFDKNDLLALAEAELIDMLPDDKILFRINKESLTYSLESYDVDNKTASAKVHLEGTMVLNSSSPILDKEKLKGLDEQEVKLYLNSFQAIKDVEVKFSPFWVSSVPKLKDHIEIEVKK